MFEFIFICSRVSFKTHLFIFLSTPKQAGLEQSGRVLLQGLVIFDHFHGLVSGFLQNHFRPVLLFGGPQVAVNKGLERKVNLSLA
jgi:hypothetical protein